MGMDSRINTMNITALVEKLYPFSYSITGDGNDKAIAQYLSELDFTVHEYLSGQTLNGWFIPHAWQVNKACIYHKNNLIYDAQKSPLALASLSPSFSGELSLAQLQQHLSSSEMLPNAILYQWQNLYRPNDITWGISMPHQQRVALQNVTYNVEIKTTLTPSTMKVLDYFLAGQSTETIIINGHNCHPFQANDDISGCAVAIRVMQILQTKAKQKPLKYSYRVIIAPELHGPMFWLDNMPSQERKQLKGCILLKSVGNNAPMRLQRSYLGDQPLDRAAQAAFKKKYGHFEQGPFRSIYGNDETVFEAPPYNIPTISLTRWPFLQYHTDLDTPAIVHEATLQDSVDLILNVIDEYEHKTFKDVAQNTQNNATRSNFNSTKKEFDITYSINFQGLVCLSAYGLYKAIPEVKHDGVDYDSLHGRWNRLMNCLPREIEAKMTAGTLAQKYNLPKEEVYLYLNQWVDNGLLTPNTNH
jgi:aminopeptidase-like protein